MRFWGLRLRGCMSRRLAVLFVWLVIAVSLAPNRGAAQLVVGAGASTQFFPFVAADAAHDTMIQLVNGSTQRIFVRCTYTPGDSGGVQAAINFDLVLTRRQPTHWIASTGRVSDPSDMPCDRETPTCDGAGIDPGRIPPLPEGFTGDLLCVQIDRSGAPMSGNALRGMATLVDRASGDVATYAAIGLAGNSFNDGDNTLCLGGTALSISCPRGAEYAACPQTWLLAGRAEGAAPGAMVPAPGARTRLVIATCSRRAGTGGATAQIEVINEVEQRFTASAPVQRWAEIALADNPIFGRDVLGTDFVQIRVRAAQASGSGIVVVALSDRATADGASAGGAIAAVPVGMGARAERDRIVFAGE